MDKTPSGGSFRARLLAIPIAIAIGAFLAWVPFLAMIFSYFFAIPVHEFGHAFAAWMGSRFAIPIGAFIPMAAVTFTSYDPSLLGGLIPLALIGGFAYSAYRFKNVACLGFALAAVAGFTRLTVLTSNDGWMPYFVFGGVAGEFWISAVLICAFYYRFPSPWRWEFFRFIALAVGAFVLVSTTWKWWRIAHFRDVIPFGTFLGGEGDASGDMDRLVQEHGWTEPRITRRCLEFAFFSWAAVIGHYFYFLRARRSSPGATES